MSRPHFMFAAGLVMLRRRNFLSLGMEPAWRRESPHHLSADGLCVYARLSSRRPSVTLQNADLPPALRASTMLSSKLTGDSRAEAHVSSRENAW
jgi:hypothetical protein